MADGARPHNLSITEASWTTAFSSAGSASIRAAIRLCTFPGGRELYLAAGAAIRRRLEQAGPDPAACGHTPARRAGFLPPGEGPQPARLAGRLAREGQRPGERSPRRGGCESAIRVAFAVPPPNALRRSISSGRAVPTIEEPRQPIRPGNRGSQGARRPPSEDPRTPTPWGAARRAPRQSAATPQKPPPGGHPEAHPRTWSEQGDPPYADPPRASRSSSIEPLTASRSFSAAVVSAESE